MSDVLTWSNVGIDVQNNTPSPVTINSISKAATGVVAYSGSDPAVGDYVLLEVNGMHEVDQRVFRVAAMDSGANTFQLEGEDTTDYSTFTSGTFSVITFGASMGTATNVTATGGGSRFADATVVHGNVAREVPTISEPMAIDIESLFKPSDPALTELRKATKTRSRRCFMFRFGTGASVPRMVLSSYVNAPGVPTGAAQEVVKTPINLRVQGLPTVYTT